MRKTLALFALLLLAVQPYDDIQSALDARVAGAPGVAIAVGIISGGKTSTYFAGSSGNSRPLDEHTLFEIGSVTKTLTATALASMVQSHQARLGDPISTYLPHDVRVPSFDGKTITMLDLAEQRSGLPRLPTNLGGAGEDPYAQYSVADMYAFLNEYKLTRAPGEQYEYSNYGIGLLGQLLANRAKEPYESLIASKVLGPLAMTDTQFATDSAPDGPPLAVGHNLGGEPVSAWHFQSVTPAGGARSSLSDMLKYLRCNMGVGPLSAACLFAQAPRAAGTPNHRIGLVWENNDSSGTIAHGGDTFGFHAFVAISKDRRTGVVVLSNGAVVSDIAAHALAPSYPIAMCSHGAASDSASSYAGTYCNALAGYTFLVAQSSSGDSLSIRLVPEPALPYERETDDTYANAAVGAAVRFVRENGNVVGFRFSQNGQAVPATRFNTNGPVVAQLPAQFPDAIALDPATLEQYAGNYSAGMLTFAVTLRGPHVFVQLTGQPAAEVYPSAKDEFFYKVVDAQITFVRNASGNVSGLVLHQDGKDVSAARQ